MTVSLIRYQSDLLGTRGVLKFNNTVLCHTLELPWRSNEKNNSCIPEGSYPSYKTSSPRFGSCFYIGDVPSRSAILIHAGNSLADTRGCVLVGLDVDDKKVLHSRLAMTRLLNKLPQTFNLEIVKLCRS